MKELEAYKKSRAELLKIFDVTHFYDGIEDRTDSFWFIDENQIGYSDNEEELDLDSGDSMYACEVSMDWEDGVKKPSLYKAQGYTAALHRDNGESFMAIYKDSNKRLLTHQQED